MQNFKYRHTLSLCCDWTLNDSCVTVVVIIWLLHLLIPQTKAACSDLISMGWNESQEQNSIKHFQHGMGRMLDQRKVLNKSTEKFKKSSKSVPDAEWLGWSSTLTNDEKNKRACTMNLNNSRVITEVENHLQIGHNTTHESLTTD